MNEFKLNTIEDALDDIRAGKVIIVVDDDYNIIPDFTYKEIDTYIPLPM